MIDEYGYRYTMEELHHRVEDTSFHAFHRALSIAREGTNEPCDVCQSQEYWQFLVRITERVQVLICPSCVSYMQMFDGGWAHALRVKHDLTDRE